MCVYRVREKIKMVWKWFTEKFWISLLIGRLLHSLNHKWKTVNISGKDCSILTTYVECSVCGKRNSYYQSNPDYTKIDMWMHGRLDKFPKCETCGGVSDYCMCHMEYRNVPEAK